MDKVIKILKVSQSGKEHESVLCPDCKNDSKPHGLGKETDNKIQLVRQCRMCDMVFWYWINKKYALIPFSED